MSYDPRKNTIEGWMHDKELVWLYEQAAKMDSVIEVGSWKGRSSHALLSGCPGTVYCIDHFKGNSDERNTAHAEASKRDIAEDFMANVGHFKNLTLFNASSTNAAWLLSDKSADMVFIDGGHVFEEILLDLLLWGPKCRKLLCGHDRELPGVKKALELLYPNRVKNAVESIWEVQLDS